MSMNLEELLELLPPLDEDQRESLAKSIKDEGVNYPVLVDENGVVLDGRNRSSLAKEVGVEYETKVLEGLSEKEKISKAFMLNLNRRQVTIEQKHAIIFGLATQFDGEARVFNNSEIARMVGVDEGSVRYVIRRKGSEISESDGADDTDPAARKVADQDDDPKRDRKQDRSAEPTRAEDEDTDREDAPSDDGDDDEQQRRRLAHPKRYSISEGKARIAQAQLISQYREQHPDASAAAIAEAATQGQIEGWEWGQINRQKVHELLHLMEMPEPVQNLISEGKIGGKVPDMLSRLYSSEVVPPIDPGTTTLLAEKFAMGALPTGGKKGKDSGPGANDAVNLVREMHEQIAQYQDPFWAELYQQFLVDNPEMSLTEAMRRAEYHRYREAHRASGRQEQPTPDEPVTDVVAHFLADQVNPFTYKALPAVLELADDLRFNRYYSDRVIAALEQTVAAAEKVIEALRQPSLVISDSEEEVVS